MEQSRSYAEVEYRQNDYNRLYFIASLQLPILPIDALGIGSPQSALFLSKIKQIYNEARSRANGSRSQHTAEYRFGEELAEATAEVINVMLDGLKWKGKSTEVIGR